MYLIYKLQWNFRILNLIEIRSLILQMLMSNSTKKDIAWDVRYEAGVFWQEYVGIIWKLHELLVKGKMVMEFIRLKSIIENNSYRQI